MNGDSAERILLYHLIIVYRGRTLLVVRFNV